MSKKAATRTSGAKSQRRVDPLSEVPSSFPSMHGRFPLEPLAVLRPAPVSEEEKRSRGKLTPEEREAYLAWLKSRFDRG